MLLSRDGELFLRSATTVILLRTKVASLSLILHHSSTTLQEFNVEANINVGKPCKRQSNVSKRCPKLYCQAVKKTQMAIEEQGYHYCIVQAIKVNFIEKIKGNQIAFLSFANNEGCCVSSAATEVHDCEQTAQGM